MIKLFVDPKVNLPLQLQCKYIAEDLYNSVRNVTCQNAYENSSMIRPKLFTLRQRAEYKQDQKNNKLPPDLYELHFDSKEHFLFTCTLFVPLHIFCSLERFLFHLYHFLLMFPRQQE